MDHVAWFRCFSFGFVVGQSEATLGKITATGSGHRIPSFLAILAFFLMLQALCFLRFANITTRSQLQLQWEFKLDAVQWLKGAALAWSCPARYRLSRSTPPIPCLRDTATTTLTTLLLLFTPTHTICLSAFTLAACQQSSSSMPAGLHEAHLVPSTLFSLVS